MNRIEPKLAKEILTPLSAIDLVHVNAEIVDVALVLLALLTGCINARGQVA
jgi:hypothetical protein